MIKSIFFVFFCATILLSACSPFTKIVEFKVPVPVPCVSESAFPHVVKSAGESVSKDSLPGKKIAEILIERESLRKTDTEFRALLIPCIK